MAVCGSGQAWRGAWCVVRVRVGLVSGGSAVCGSCQAWRGALCVVRVRVGLVSGQGWRCAVAVKPGVACNQGQGWPWRVLGPMKGGAHGTRLVTKFPSTHLAQQAARHCTRKVALVQK